MSPSPVTARHNVSLSQSGMPDRLSTPTSHDELAEVIHVSASRGALRNGTGVGSSSCTRVRSDHGLVFAKEDGTPIPPEYVTKRFADLVREAGLRPARFHDLRHGRASLFLASG